VRFQFFPEQQTWRLENSRIRAVFELTSQRTFEFRGLENVITGDDFTPPLGARISPLRFDLDSSRIDEHSEFTLVDTSSRPIPRRGMQQSIVLDEAAGLGRITLLLEMYDDQSALRYRWSFENRLQQQVSVRYIDLMPWAFDSRDVTWRTFHVNQWSASGTAGNFETFARPLPSSGEMTIVQSGAHGPHCGWLALRDGKDRGLFAGWEFDGRATAAVQHLADVPSLQMLAMIHDLKAPVAPGAVFAAPWAFLGVFRGDWDDAGWQTQRFVEAALAQPVPDQNFPYVMWDSWKYSVDIDETRLRRNAEIASRLGIEVFVVDLGWARALGDWRPDPAKFPSGMRALSDYVHSLGMKFGLHFPLAEADLKSPVLVQNPDWTSTDRNQYYHGVSLCLSHRAVRDWLVRETVRMIDEYNIDWILQDGENMVKLCTKSSHSHDPENSNYSNSVEGLNAVVAAVQTRRPRVHWENCENGGNMMTYNMVRRYVTSIAADDSGPLTTRQAIHGITYPFPPRYSDRYMPEETLTPYITRSYMFGGPWIFMNRLPQMSALDLDIAQREIALFKTLRARIREGRVYHLTSRPTENGTDAIQSYHEASDTSTVFVYRARSPFRFRFLRLRGLKRDGNYIVTFQESTATLILTGAQLMDSGLRVSLPTTNSAEIVHLRPAGQ